MNGASVFFNQFGIVLLAVAYVLSIVLFVFIALLWRRISKIFRGESLDIETVLRSVQDKQTDFEASLGEHRKHIEFIEDVLPHTIRKIGLVRFNPFSDAGGDQSFTLALLDEKGSGVVVSSLYGRELSRTYAKPIEKGASTYQLSDEEKKAIAEALG